MTIYQDELLRIFPSLECEGRYNSDTDMLDISYHRIQMCSQNKNGFIYENARSRLTGNLAELQDAISVQTEKIREYVSLYESSSQMAIPDVKQYRKLSEFGDNLIECNKHSSVPANTDVMRAENEIGRLLDTRDIDIAEAKNKMLDCISLKYRCIPKDNNISERLKAEFEVSSPLSNLFLRPVRKNRIRDISRRNRKHHPHIEKRSTNQKESEK